MPLERFGFLLSSLRNLGSNKQITLRFFVTVTAFLAAYSAAETNFVLLWSAPRLPLPSTHGLFVDAVVEAVGALKIQFLDLAHANFLLFLSLSSTFRKVGRVRFPESAVRGFSLHHLTQHRKSGTKVSRNFQGASLFLKSFLTAVFRPTFNFLFRYSPCCVPIFFQRQKLF